MQVLIKSADISNVLKPFAVARGWALRVMDEFFLQGDLESQYGLPVTVSAPPRPAPPCASTVPPPVPRGERPLCDSGKLRIVDFVRLIALSCAALPRAPAHPASARGGRRAARRGG